MPVFLFLACALIGAHGAADAPPSPPAATAAAPRSGVPVTTRLRYDAATEKTITGRVAAIHDLKTDTNATVRELEVAAAEGTVMVRLGPQGFLKRVRLPVSVGDTVEVVGSQVKDGERRVLLARKLTAGGQTFELRSAEGRFSVPGRPGRQPRGPRPEASPSPAS